MKTLFISRFKVTDNYSIGHCYLVDEDCEKHYLAHTLERGWVDNKKRVSCVPDGIYNLKLEWSNKFKCNLWELYGVEDRSECKFHAANYWYELNGCIALGNKHKDIDGDGDPDVTSSRVAMKRLHKALQGQTFSQVEIRTL